MTNVLQWVKSHLAIVIMCAVSIIVLPVVIYVSGTWNAKIAKQIESRVSDQTGRIKRVSDVSIAITPLTPEDEGIEARRTINQKILDDFRTAREKIKADAERLEQLAIEINRAGKEQQLVPGLLPKPERSVAQDLPYRIHDAYVAAHEALLAQLNAAMPQDLTLVQEQLLEYRDNYLRSQFNVSSVSALGDEDYQKLTQAMTDRRLAIYAQIARGYSVYADADVFALQEWNRQQAPDALRWFEWQHTYWVNRDIVDAVNKANSADGERRTIAGPKSSVIKRIRSITVEPIFPPNMTEQSLTQPVPGQYGPDPDMGGFNEGGMMEGGFNEGGMMEGGMMEGGMAMEGGGRSGMSKFNPEGAPTAGQSGSTGAAQPVDPGALADPNQPFPTDFTKSISGRTDRTGLYDMRKVTLEVIVDSTRLDELFEAINSTNFMTVTGCRVLPLEPERELANGYLYGADPVIAARIDIETLWIRDWTVKLMPDPVKKFFDIPTEEDPQG